jgi:hypothetical protein
MKKPFTLVTLMLFLACAAAAQKPWVGVYTFDEDGGRNAGGTKIFISHELTVMETDDGLIAHLESNGYQTSKDLNCKAKINGTKLGIYFDSYGENNIFESYSPGDLLFTLESRTTKGKSELLTFWGKFTPIIPKNEKTGKAYFVRSGRIET